MKFHLTFLILFLLNLPTYLYSQDYQIENGKFISHYTQANWITGLELNRNLTRIGLFELDPENNLTIGTQINSGVNFRTNGTGRLFISKNGNIGIKTETPNSPLSIGFNNASKQFSLVGQNLSESFTLQLDFSDQILFKNINANGNYIFQSNVGGQGIKSTLFIDGSTGNIGIGTNSPKESLHLYGNLRFQKTGDKIYWDWEHRTIEQYSSGGISRMIRFRNSMDGSNPDGGFDFANHMGVSVLRINQGKVGIGTTNLSGTHKLFVEGTIGAREIKVESSGWSDFVFQENYSLLEIDKLEEFIVKNKHLPEIPNEEEVQKNGIELGKMDAKLLQKIEELTLYIIEINKRLNDLEEENNLLKSKVNI